MQLTGDDPMPPEPSTALVLAPTLQAFVAGPTGRYIVLRTSLHFFARHGALSGVVMWGEPTEADVSRMLTVTLGIASVAGPRVAIVDARQIGRVDPFSFRALTRYAEEHTSSIVRRITKLAVVHAQDIAGAVAAGFFHIVRLPIRSETFTQVEQALAWLSHAEEAPLLAEVDALAAKAQTLPAEVRDLVALLEGRPTATLAGAASGLAISKRTLQRLLAEHGTSFRSELDAARVRVAQRLLLESSEPIARVAIEVGCSTPQQLSGLFRRVVGESPREWRARVRRAP
ncbi:MAG TPA: helix-turn-helix transcriptional regulator [Polyangiaceae bacterium]